MVKSVPGLRTSLIKPNDEEEIITSLVISHVVLERIEELRSGGRLYFEIDYRPTLLAYGDVVGTEEILKQSVGRGEIEAYALNRITEKRLLVQLTSKVRDARTNGTEMEITADRWLDTLEKLQYRKYRTIEVPSIKEEDEDLSDIIENLDRAWRLMTENYQESLNACRKALESVKIYMKNYGYISNKDIDFEKLYGGESFGKAIDGLFRSIWGLTDIGSHTGRGKMTTRADMELVITSIYMLLKSIIEVKEMGPGERGGEEESKREKREDE